MAWPFHRAAAGTGPVRAPADADAAPTIDQGPPASAVDAMVPGALPPEDLDPLADGILMAHQKSWLADDSPLKQCEKGRRTGITFAEALDCTLIAAADRSAGGDNVFYIGDTKDKGREFIETCARFAKHVAAELLDVQEFLFEDRQDDGSSKYISAFRIAFASGYKIVALSSRPANIRGLQGVVVIDEAAFHPNVRAVIDACNALLIWGGRIRIISTHNGVTNPFNDLLREARASKNDYSVHLYTFDDAVANGLYERVCLIRGETPTAEGKAAWYRKVRRSYGSRVEAMREELDAIPREGEGTAIPRVHIEACSSRDYKVVRWAPPTTDFVQQPEAARRAHMQQWLMEHVQPLIDALPDRSVHLGEDFGMRQDKSALAVGYIAQNLVRHVPFLIELAQCPYDQQKQVFKFVADQVRLHNAMLDANGNGMVLAQEMAQAYGSGRIQEVIANQAWYREHGPKLRAAFEDGTIRIPADRDVVEDLTQLRTIDGVIKLPKDVRQTGTDGGKRHGDAAMALYFFYIASVLDTVAYGYTPAPRPRPLDEPADGGRGMTLGPPPDEDNDWGGGFKSRGTW